MNDSPVRILFTFWCRSIGWSWFWLWSEKQFNYNVEQRDSPKRATSIRQRAKTFSSNIIARKNLRFHRNPLYYFYVWSINLVLLIKPDAILYENRNKVKLVQFQSALNSVELDKYSRWKQLLQPRRHYRPYLSTLTLFIWFYDWFSFSAVGLLASIVLLKAYLSQL